MPATVTAQNTTSPIDPPEDAVQVVGFWREAGYDRWFKKDAAFDAEFRDRFSTLHDAASADGLDVWRRSPDGALALIILLDQFPRNVFRGTPRMFATDVRALDIAERAIADGHDRTVDPVLRVFFYLPFEHSESLADQNRSVALTEPLGAPYLGYAEVHRDVIRRFGRFPHRNAILGRVSTDAETAFLAAGGFAG